MAKSVFLMRESVLEPVYSDFRPAVVWAWAPGERILIRALQGWEGWAHDIEIDLASARSRGWSDEALWQHYARQCGCHQFSIRTLPERMDATSLERAAEIVLQEMGNGRA
jgi:hypothetical protein